MTRRLGFLHGRRAHVVLTVHRGRATVEDVRALRAELEGERAALGLLVLHQPPCESMQVEAVRAGHWQPAGGAIYRRLQLVTLAELRTGHHPHLPGGTLNLVLRTQGSVVGGSTATSGRALPRAS